MMTEDKQTNWVKIPQKEASSEEWARFFNELGRPNEAAAYQFSAAEAQFYDAELASDFKNIAHKAGLNQQQAQIVHDGMVEILTEKYQQHQLSCQQSKQQLMGQLQQKWGASYPDKLKKAQKAAQHFGFEGEALDQIENIVGSEATLEGLCRMGEGLTKDTSLMDMELKPAMTSVQTAKQKRAELSRDASFLEALMDKMHPSHKEAIAELDRLNAIIATPQGGR